MSVRPAVRPGDDGVRPDRSGTPTPGSGPTCIGDCDASGGVTVSKLITLVDIALGNAQPSACPRGIPNGAGVDITLIIQGVNNALNGCVS